MLTTGQIIYVAIIGSVMLMAFLEWFLWLAAFLYCLWKVYQKADIWSIKLLAVLNAVFFIAMRYASFTSSTINCD